MSMPRGRTTNQPTNEPNPTQLNSTQPNPTQPNPALPNHAIPNLSVFPLSKTTGPMAIPTSFHPGITSVVPLKAGIKGLQQSAFRVISHESSSLTDDDD
uniref:Uncharacterized protein n=1 Tax=Vespula pensylvanica TaxID=30213 RepID=A0A834K880_VESPE|nr:hypothetical protein H0235_015906 [Vespula pensylvanica]